MTLHIIEAICSYHRYLLGTEAYSIKEFFIVGMIRIDPHLVPYILKKYS
jgi:hypothetical protein